MKTFDIDEVMKTLKREVKNYPSPVVDLIKVQTNDPYRILVATILSARTKDQTTALVVHDLFKRAPNIKTLATLKRTELEKIIYRIGFYKNKATFLEKLAKELLEQHKGEVPHTMEELLTLPGVGRKTANLVLATAFSIPAICVDIHVHRITNRWGYVKTETPFETEMALRKKLPKKHWLDINKTVVAFGQHLCGPVPRCSSCPIKEHCQQKNLKKWK
ncbi:MAG: endonuclease III [Candidatus Woesearchaeota archaeon]|nr:MAG: endonuclease III [Candidatus Woesearchaeota archaeon]